MLVVSLGRGRARGGERDGYSGGRLKRDEYLGKWVLRGGEKFRGQRDGAEGGDEDQRYLMLLCGCSLTPKFSRYSLLPLVTRSQARGKSKHHVRALLGNYDDKTWRKEGPVLT